MINYLFILTLMTFLSCSKNEEPCPKEANNPPNDFELREITDGATNVYLIPYFNWDDTTDPDGDDVTYDMLIDECNPPSSIVAKNIPVTDFAIKDQLKYNTKYFWMVIARDSQGNSTNSDIFSFTTRTNNH